MKITNMEKFKTDITNALMAGLPYDYIVERTTIGKTTEFCNKAYDYEFNYYATIDNTLKCVALYDIIEISHRKARKKIFVSIDKDNTMIYVDKGDAFDFIHIGADFGYYNNRLKYMVEITSYIINFFKEV